MTASSKAFKASLYMAGLFVLAFFFANVEVQIEGAAGWAANLPTWRIEKHPLLDIFMGGKTLTGYHFWVFTFMLLAFHIPVFMTGRTGLKTEARIIGGVMLFWIIEDFLWFVLNPAFGMGRFRPDSVPWHKHWLAGVPVDYLIFIMMGSILIWFSYRGEDATGLKS